MYKIGYYKVFKWWILVYWLNYIKLDNIKSCLMNKWKVDRMNFICCCKSFVLMSIVSWVMKSYYKLNECEMNKNNG